MIPRIIHQFWAEGDPPEVASWRTLEGWIHVLWSLDNLPEWFRPSEQWNHPEKYTVPYHNPSERLYANILRFELLGEMGGVWADCDMELIGDLNQLLVGDCNLAMFGQQIGTGFIAAKAHHPFVESCRHTLREMERPVAVASMWAASQAPVDDVTFLEPELVYPGPYWDVETDIRPKVLMNHPRKRPCRDCAEKRQPCRGCGSASVS